MSDESNSRWALPYAIGYSNFVKIIRHIKNNNAASKYIPLKTILNLASINPQVIKQNISFCEITKIIEGDFEKGYKLTGKGAAYAEALTLEKDELIKKTSLEIIENSYLKELKVVVETEGTKITRADFYKAVKNIGNVSDGKRFGNMPPAYSTGTGTLLEIFVKAELIPNELLSTASNTQNKNSKNSASKSTKNSPKQSSKKSSNVSNNENTSSNLIQLGRLIVKDIGVVDINDEDTLSLAEMYLDILRKKIKSKDQTPA